MAAMVLDPDRLARSRDQGYIELAQIHLCPAPVGFFGRAALDAARKLQHRFVVQVLLVEIPELHGSVHQRYRRGVGDAVIGGLAVAGAPFLRTVSHDGQPALRGVYVDFPDIAGIAGERAGFQGRSHHRLRESTEGKLLDVTLHDPERVAAAAERRQLERRPAHDVEKAVAAFEHPCGAVHSARSELDREHRVPVGVRIAARLPLRNAAHARLVQCDIGGDGQVDRFDGLLLGQPVKTRCTGNTRYRAHRGMIDAALLVVPGVADAAEHFVGEHGGDDQIATTGARNLGSRQQRRDAVAGMPAAAADVAIIEVEVTYHHVVRENGELGARFLAAAEQGCRVGAAYRRSQIACDPGGLAVVAAERAAQSVQYETLGLVYDLLREVFV